MNYKQELHNDQPVVEDRSVRIFGISLMVWIFSGFIFIAIAALASPSLRFAIG